VCFIWLLLRIRIFLLPCCVCIQTHLYLVFAFRHSDIFHHCILGPFNSSPAFSVTPCELSKRARGWTPAKVHILSFTKYLWWRDNLISYDSVNQLKLKTKHINCQALHVKTERAKPYIFVHMNNIKTQHAWPNSFRILWQREIID